MPLSITPRLTGATTRRAWSGGEAWNILVAAVNGTDPRHARIVGTQSMMKII
ncbi:hypothetical protein [Streptomyces niveus]|uniref:hypothetical protein n=1 Tax=Streptomyces niveus TaxID=193462 RepID=UPI0034276C58